MIQSGNDPLIVTKTHRDLTINQDSWMDNRSIVLIQARIYLTEHQQMVFESDSIRKRS